MLTRFKGIHFIALLCLLFAASSVYALEPIDTQIGQDGMSVHLMKAKVNNGVLTVSILLDNDTDGAVSLIRPNINEIHYVAGSKKYPVLKDSNGAWLASPVHDEDNLFEGRHNGAYYLPQKKKVVAWFKLPAPPEGTTSIEISVPGVSPFSADIK